MAKETALAVVVAETSENNQLTQQQEALRSMTLNTVRSEHSRRVYAGAIDSLYAFAGTRPLSRALITEWKASMAELSPGTVNVRLSAIRKMVTEARRNGYINHEDAANLTDIPNANQRGQRMGNWLARNQVRELLAVPDRGTLKGKRDHTILALLLGCALRRHELAKLELATVQMREGRWVLVDLRGKGGRVRTVTVPLWVKHSIDAWTEAAGIVAGRLLRPLSRGHRIIGDELQAAMLWRVVRDAGRKIGIDNFGAHDLRRTCAKLCRSDGAKLEQIQIMLGHSSVQTTERYLGSQQDIAIGPNDSLVF